MHHAGENKIRSHPVVGRLEEIVVPFLADVLAEQLLERVQTLVKAIRQRRPQASLQLRDSIQAGTWFSATTAPLRESW